MTAAQDKKAQKARQINQAWRSLTQVRVCLTALPGPDNQAAAAAAARQACLLKPPGSLGQLEDMVTWLAAWQARTRPICVDPAVLIFAGSHGVAHAYEVSAYPPTVTAQMVASYEAGGAAINQLCAAVGATLRVIPLDIQRPTSDITQVPALTEAEGLAALNAGRAAVAALSACDVLAVGEMGIGNTTIAAALCAQLHGGGGADWVGLGTGVNARGLRTKREVVGAALMRHQQISDPQDPLGVMLSLGGRELAALVGAMIAARLRGLPVLLDGFVVAAAASVLFYAGGSSALDHIRAGHVSAEPGHRRALARLGLSPYLDLEMRLGEASGAALAINLIRASLACYDGMATFAEAHVDSRNVEKI